jgi:hypothetical protein
MQGRDRERWHELSKQALDEQDPVKLQTTIESISCWPRNITACDISLATSHREVTDRQPPTDKSYLFVL